MSVTSFYERLYGVIKLVRWDDNYRMAYAEHVSSDELNLGAEGQWW